MLKILSHPIQKSFKSLFIASWRWWSIRILYFSAFIYGMGYTVVISTLFSYLQKINPAVTGNMYGWVVSGYGIGGILSPLIFGIWSKYRQSRQPMVCSLIIECLANILYCYCIVFPPKVGIWIVMLCRILIGFAAGILSVLRACIAACTTEEERLGVMANFTLSRTLGYILGPLLSTLLSPLGEDGLNIPQIKFSLNVYTAPSYVLAILAFINLLCLLVYKEIRVYKHPSETKTISSITTIENSLIEIQPLLHNNITEEEFNVDSAIRDRQLPKYSKIGAVACFIIYHFVWVLFTIFETIGPILSSNEYAWTRTQVIFYNNLQMTVVGLATLMTCLVVKFLANYIQESKILIGSLLLCSLGFFIYIPWPGPLPNFEIIQDSNSTFSTLGCDVTKMSWCAYIPKLSLVQFLLAPTLLSIALPITVVMNVTILSKLIGPFPMGFEMGILSIFGFFAHFTAPIFETHLLTSTGPQFTFGVFSAIPMAMVIFVLIVYYKLVPYKYTHLFIINDNL